jgi:NADH dehydrogenase [ubiquinone] 1 alpha subcomplex assembly factor 6
MAWRRNTSTGSKESASEYCISLVKSSDFDNYLCGLLFPARAKRAFFAIRAFNVEIAQIRDHSNNNFLTGRIRFQFWRDSLEKIYTDNYNDVDNLQPVMQELRDSIKTHGLTRRYFERCIEARLADFAGSAGYQTLSDLESYAESSQSSLLYLLLEALGAVPKDNEGKTESLTNSKVAHAASHVGCSFGLMTLLRGLPHHLAQVAEP